MKAKINPLLFVLVAVILFGYTNVSALENNKAYVNTNGIEVTEKEYRFINDFYGSDFFESMTLEDLEWISDLNINENNVEIKSISDSKNISNDSNYRGPSYSTNSKSLVIAKSCSSICTVITNLTWLVNPSVRSYDLIGARFYNTSLANDTITTKLTSSNGTQYSSNNKVLSNGFATSVLLPNGASNIKVQQKFYTQPYGTVYASYQHATSNISLQDSLKFTIGVGGYGNVFHFYDGAVGIYDGMSGVNISL